MMHVRSWPLHAATNFFSHVRFGFFQALNATITAARTAFDAMNGAPTCLPPSDEHFPTSRTWILHAR